jgi:hypothetical protein
MNKIVFLLIVGILMSSCGGFKNMGKILRNEKVNSNDEFLVEKKTPLRLPPDFDKIPEPGSMVEKKQNNNEGEIKKILKIPKDKTSPKKKPSSVEESILKSIQK